jgi:hypothetical protein
MTIVITPAITMSEMIRPSPGKPHQGAPERGRRGIRG